MGKVVLVGAGPGDEGLLTLKGEKYIKEADCLVYDRLSSPKLLELAKQKLNEKGYHPAMMTDPEACVACASCARTCPDAVITIEKE